MRSPTWATLAEAQNAMYVQADAHWKRGLTYLADCNTKQAPTTNVACLCHHLLVCGLHCPNLQLTSRLQGLGRVQHSTTFRPEGSKRAEGGGNECTAIEPCRGWGNVVWVRKDDHGYVRYGIDAIGALTKSPVGLATSRQVKCRR